MLPRILPVALLLTALLMPTGALAAGPADATPGNRWVDATFTLTQPDLRTLKLDGDLLFYEYDVEGSRYTADDMGQAYRNAATFTRGPAKGDELVTKIESQARASLEATLAAAFPTATRTITRVELDRSTLVAASGNEYDPGVLIDVAATITRTNADLGLGDYSDAAVAAVFKAGALVTSEFSLSSQAGYNSVYRIGAPESPAGLVFAAPTGEGATLSADGKTLVVGIDNTRGADTATRAIGVSVKDATALAPTEEDIRTSVDITLGEIKSGGAAIPITTKVAAELRAVDLAERFPGILPSKVSLAHINADALRALRAAGAVKDENLAKADDALMARIRDDLAASLKTAVTVDGGLDRTDLAAAPAATYAAEPPVGFAAVATGNYRLEGAGAENLDLALDIGASIVMDMNLFASKTRETTFTLHPPPGVSFARAEKGVITQAGKTATFVVPPSGEGDASHPVSLRMAKDGVTVYDAEKAELNVVVDLKDLDITIGRAVNGDMGDLVVDVGVVGNLNVIKVPDDLRAGFDSRLDLDYLSSDALRLLRQRGVLDDANLSKLETQLLDEVKRNLGNALGAEVVVTGGFDRASLDPAAIATPLNGDKPVVFTAQTSFRKSLTGAPAPQAAIALYTQQQSFVLPKVQGLDTVYTVILPAGLAVTDLTAPGAQTETGKSADGRDQFTVRPTDNEATATVSMAVTPGFVVAKFWPVLLLAVMVILLLVGTPVALIAMRRKKKGAAGKK